MELIDKSVLVAEIERLISNGQTKLKDSEECKDYESYSDWAERIATYINVLSLLDTLETKEVDLEKEIHKWIECNTCRGYCSADIRETAEYFYELGLKAQKGK